MSSPAPALTVPPGIGSASAAAQTGIPALYAASKFVSLARSGTFDPRSNLYVPANLSNPFYNFRTGIARAKDGGICRVLLRGDSRPDPWFPSTLPYAQTWGPAMAAKIAARTGLPFTFGIAPPDTADTRQTFGSGWALSGGVGAAQGSTIGGAYTYVSTDAGDRVIIPYRKDVFTATVTIDGVAKAPITNAVNSPTQSGWAVYTGLAVQAHTVVITLTAGASVLIGGVGIEVTGGIAFSTWGVPGESTPDPGGAPFPTPGSTGMYYAAATQGGPSWDLFLTGWGTNDWSFQSRTPAQTAANLSANLAQITAAASPSDFAAIIPTDNGTANITPSVWSQDDVAAGIYYSAQQGGFPVIDMRQCWGPEAKSSAAGLMNADNTHYTAAGSTRIGLDCVNAIGAASNL